MVLSNVIVDITIPRRSFVFGQSRAVETSVIVNNNSPVYDYVHPDDQTQPSFDTHSVILVITALFTNMRTLKFKSRLRNCVFRCRQS